MGEMTKELGKKIFCPQNFLQVETSSNIPTFSLYGHYKWVKIAYNVIKYGYFTVYLWAFSLLLAHYFGPKWSQMTFS